MRMPIRDPERIAAQGIDENKKLPKTLSMEEDNPKTTSKKIDVSGNSETLKNTAVKGETGNRIKDDGGNELCVDESLPPNRTFTLNGVEYKTDDNGNICCIDGENLPGTEFCNNGQIHAKIENERPALLPRNGGEWTGTPGDSEWKPNSNIEPGDRHGTNPEHKSWEQIMKEYHFEVIPFHEDEPDFSEVAKGSVEIADFSTDRDANFDQADEKLANERGCTPEEVAKWREENKYTWHECKDCKTMQKVPTEVHGNISHTGGISELKLQNQKS